MVFHRHKWDRALSIQMVPRAIVEQLPLPDGGIWLDTNHTSWNWKPKDGGPCVYSFGFGAPQKWWRSKELHEVKTYVNYCVKCGYVQKPNGEEALWNLPIWEGHNGVA